MMRKIAAGMAARIDQIAVVTGAVILVAVAFTFGPVVGWIALGAVLIALGVAGR